MCSNNESQSEVEKIILLSNKQSFSLELLRVQDNKVHCGVILFEKSFFLYGCFLAFSFFFLTLWYLINFTVTIIFPLTASKHIVLFIFFLTEVSSCNNQNSCLYSMTSYQIYIGVWNLNINYSLSYVVVFFYNIYLAGFCTIID